jgi:FkbM family methyltransferase
VKELEMYEPDPECYALLEKNLPDAELHKEAIGVSAGVMRKIKGKGIMNASVGIEGPGEQVRVVPLRDLLERYADIVKMDIEGLEWEVLQDLCSTPEMLRMCGYWMVEFHDSSQAAVRSSQIREAFASIGYKNMQKGNVMHFYHDSPKRLK